MQALAPVFHGGAPRGAAALLDFSVNSNPLGAAPAVLAAARTASVERYPDPSAGALRHALAQRHGVSAERVVVGNGSAELLWLLALAYLQPGDRVLIAGPTFGEYARAARLMGAIVVDQVAPASAGFQPDVAQLARRIQAEAPRLVFVCNPNNPTGSYLSCAAIASLLDAAPGLLVLDQAYVNFVEAPWDVRPLLAEPRLVVLRSLTKDHALAGLRLGYLVAAPDVAANLARVQPPWSVNAPAQAAGLAALAADAHVALGRAAARAAVAFLATGLAALGLRPLPTAANFLLVEVGDAARLTAALLAEGVYVRDCSSFGLPQHIRVAARPLDECAALLRALERVCVGTAR